MKIVGLGLLIFAITFAQSVDYNSVDAVTSASRKYGISAGKAYADSCILTIKNPYRNGTLALKYGKTSAMTDGNIVVPVNTGSPIAKLKGLSPKVKYYFTLHGTWNGRTYPNLGSGTFTTYSPTAINEITGNEISNSFAISISAGTLNVTIPHGSEYHFIGYSILGKQIFKLNAPLAQGIHSIHLPQELVPGAYIVMVQSGNVKHSQIVRVQ